MSAKPLTTEAHETGVRRVLTRDLKKSLIIDPWSSRVVMNERRVTIDWYRAEFSAGQIAAPFKGGLQDEAFKKGLAEALNEALGTAASDEPTGTPRSYRITDDRVLLMTPREEMPNLRERVGRVMERAHVLSEMRRTQAA